MTYFSEDNTSAGMAAERASLVPGTPMWGEHRARYQFAARFVEGRSVLDIACGTGFGAGILIEHGAERVFGADFAAEALIDARNELPINTHLLRADGTMLPFPDNSIDVVTSFETVEHITDHSGFIAELARVLKPDGRAVISTPNALYTKPVNGKPLNPFHLYEFTPTEYRDLLEPHFSSVELLGQRVTTQYRICPYFEKPEMLPRDLVSRIKTIGWKLGARLPAPIRESAARLVSGHTFYPGEHDFVFDATELDVGYVQVAVCVK
ncbi:MAG: class I SAM-dependent methyltransferase [Acidobacteriota bacterium]|nr:MAG: class I SAM-dependent methyltransferase [Acidobacteriota bacterium]